MGSQEVAIVTATPPSPAMDGEQCGGEDHIYLLRKTYFYILMGRSTSHVGQHLLRPSTHSLLTHVLLQISFISNALDYIIGKKKKC